MLPHRHNAEVRTCRPVALAAWLAMLGLTAVLAGCGRCTSPLPANFMANYLSDFPSPGADTTRAHAGAPAAPSSTMRSLDREKE